jgi:hypothetical protein
VGDPLLIALVATGVLLLAPLLLVAGVRLSGRRPGWYERAAHASSEARERTAVTAAEFADWLRLGR